VSYTRKKSRRVYKKTGNRKKKAKSTASRKPTDVKILDEITQESNQAVNFFFDNPDLKFYEFSTTDKARELAQEYNYRPYMIERYFRMFGEQETKQLLEGNEIPSNPCIRINTLKMDEISVLKSLKTKGYILNKIESIPTAYEIIKNSSDIKNNFQNERSQEFDNEHSEEIDFTRTAEDLKDLNWGKPHNTGLKDDLYEKSSRRIRNGKIKIKRQIGTLGSTHEYLKGFYYIQSKASLFPTYFLNPSKNDTILDMCAAPGGKTTHIAQLMENEGRIIAAEINSHRINSLVFNLRRCGIKNVTVLNVNANDLLKYNIHPDKILLDAPCSGEGLIRNDKTRKQNKSPKDISRHMAIQGNLLKNAFKLLNPNGLIMYSTCSIAPEENEFVIQSLLDKYPKAKIVDINDNIGHPGYTEVFGVSLSYDMIKARRFFPQEHDTIGFFYCLIKKCK